MLRIQQWTAVLAVGIVMTLIGCKADQNTFTEPNASIGTGDGSGSIDATAGFKLSLKAKAGVTTLLHKFGDYAAACEIAKGTTTPTSINCLLNMMEYDLYFYGFDLQVTVPADTCSFLEEDPYRFWKAEPGAGPTAIRVVIDGTGAMTSCRVDGEDIDGTGPDPSINIIGNVCYSGEATILASGTATCRYNKGSVNGPKCCTGKGTVTVTKTEGTETSTTATEVDWGGTYEECTESPHDFVDDWPKLKDKAAPIIIGLSGASYSQVTKFPSVIKLQTDSKRSSTRAVYLHANMYDWAGYQANPATWGTNPATVPTAFETDIDRGPLGDRSTANGATDLDSYVHGEYAFRCMGPAGEVKHRINLWVQSWNTREQFIAYLESGDYAAADPYVQGVSGVNCEAVGTGRSCNSLWSFDDLTAVYGAGYLYPNEYLNILPP